MFISIENSVIVLIVISLLAFVISKLAGKQQFAYIKHSIMTANELDFFYRLVNANEGGYVFPQVAMSALISPASKNRKNRISAFNKISRKRVDYAIYTNKLELLCIVELDDRTHNPARDVQRDAMFSSAGIHTIRWHSKKKPDVTTIREKFDQLRTEINNVS